jgi:hypothetical protein
MSNTYNHKKLYNLRIYDRENKIQIEIIIKDMSQKKKKNMSCLHE